MIPVFDSHTHAYPEAISDKAVTALGRFYSFHVDGQGTFGDLSEHCRGRIRGFLLFSVATSPHQVRPINDFIAEKVRLGRTMGFQTGGFGGMHQDFDEMEEELGRIEALGLKGVKLHPDIQGVDIDDPRLLRLYRLCEGRLPIYFHIGDQRKEYPFSAPEKLVKILKDYPRLTVIAAHLGGYHVWERAHVLAGHPQVYFDCSSCFDLLSPEEVVSLIRLLGEDRVFFGSDYPCHYPEKELERFLRFPLTEEEKRKILWKNAQKFFGLEDE